MKHLNICQLNWHKNTTMTLERVSFPSAASYEWVSYRMSCGAAAARTKVLPHCLNGPVSLIPGLPSHVYFVYDNKNVAGK